MSDIVLTEEQRLAVEDRGGEILVSAAAGSGKTRVLVERLLRQVTQEGADIDQFLIITYTNAAAAELRAKIMDAVFDRIAEDPTNARLRREAGLVGRARISTIHGFCAGVIRENAHRLELPPDFRVADEQEAGILKRQALTELLEELYDSGDPGFAALADTMGAGRSDAALESVILETHVKLLSHPDPDRWAREQLKALELQNVTDVGKTAWGRVIMDRARESAVFWRERMDYLLDEAAADPNVMKGYGASLRATADSLDMFIKALDGTWDEARAASEIAFPSGRLSGYDELKAQRKRCREAMDKTAELFWDSSERALEDMRAVAPAMESLLTTVLEFDRRYSQLKRRRGVLDFSDQEHLALDLLTDEDGGPTQTAREISQRFREIMVDEYQDVNEIQERIFAAVSRGGRNVFTVGDVKQSIYRFRLADPTIFLRKYTSFKDAGDALDGEPRRIVLSQNFRSRDGILEAANFIFRNLMSRRLGDLEYTPREYLYPGAKFPDSGEAQVELDVIDMAAGDDAGEDEDKSRAEAIFAARRVKELVATGRVSDGKGGLRPIGYGDVCVLMRSVRSALPTWQEAFAQEGVPLTSEQPTDFFTEFEVSLTLSILEIIDNPRQDIPLISVLRSPVWGFTGDELGRIRLYDRDGDFWSALRLAAGEMERCAGFLRELTELRQLAPDMTADELIWEIYGRSDMFALVSAMPDGQTRRENLMLLLELARSYEGAGYRGLFGFMSYIRRLRDQGGGPQGHSRARENAVTVMSIHKSKGLEFPVVILARLTVRFNMDDLRARLLIHPELGVGPKRTDLARKIEYSTVARRAVSVRLRREMMSEELRVLYVAMTRPKDKLIMLAPYADWSRSVGKLLNSELPAPPELLEGCQSMADWILMAALRRPECGELRLGAPNVPCDTSGEPWEARLIQGVAPAAKRQTVQEKAKPAGTVDTGRIRERLEYVYPHMDAVAMPSKLTATELKGTYRTQEANEEAQNMSSEPAQTAMPPRRPAFMEGVRKMTAAERGIAAHTVMQYAEYSKCVTPEGAAGEIARLRAMGTITEEQAGSVDPKLISGFFATPPGKLILSAERVYRELKFSILVDSADLPVGGGGEKLLLQGVVDCCVETDGGLTVIDFKTDHVTSQSAGERAAYYAGQLEAYALAMERILGKPVVGKIVCFLTAGVYKEIL